jgi:hypothetical protein
VSGTSISFGTAVSYASATTTSISNTFDSNTGTVVVSYRDESNSNKGTFVTGTVSGTGISFTSPTVFEGDATNYITSSFDNNSNKVVIAYQDAGNSSYGTAIVVQPPGSVPNLTAENYIGMSQGGTVADGSSATVDIIGSLSTNQSGLTAGQSYYVQTDGTIGETADDPSVFAGTAISATSLVVKT